MPKRMSLAVLVLAAALAEALSAPRPHRPLERTPSELAWAAWLRREESPAAPPRRITTKSLFVFPHLGPEALPACAEGYRPDGMGRCVKVVKFDESAHLDFLLQRLNDQFAAETTESLEEDYDYGPAEGEGPFQLSLPLASSDAEEGSGEDSSTAATTDGASTPDATTETTTVVEDELAQQIEALKGDRVREEALAEAIGKLADVTVAGGAAPERKDEGEAGPLEYWSRGGASGPQRRRGRPLF